jgi:uncharacterized protein (TIGR03067 family)
MTRCLAALLVLLPLIALADEPDPEPPATGPKQLDGEWELVARKLRGREIKVAGGKAVLLVIKNGKITRQPPLRGKGKARVVSSTIRIDSRQSPAHIDTTTTTATTTRTTYGIFKLSGDELTLCAGTINAAARPKDFESATTVLVYKRKKN